MRYNANAKLLFCFKILVPNPLLEISYDFVRVEGNQLWERKTHNEPNKDLFVLREVQIYQIR